MKHKFYLLIATVALSLAVGIVMKDAAIATIAIVSGAVAGALLKINAFGS